MRNTGISLTQNINITTRETPLQLKSGFTGAMQEAAKMGLDGRSIKRVGWRVL
jgi:hypothetical protein